MNAFSAMAQANEGFLLLIATTITWYIAARAALDALPARWATKPLPRAVAQWIPTAAMALYGIWSNRPEVAVTVIFATCVAALSLVLGILVLSGPSPVIASEARRPWALVAPVALLTFLAGFKGHFTLAHAVIFLFQGLVIVYLLMAPVRSEPVEGQAASAEISSRDAWMRGVQFLLALAVAGLGAWIGGLTTDHMSTTAHYLTRNFVTAAMLSPALMLPIIGTGSELVHEGKFQTAMSSLVSVVLLNLCLLLPVVIIFSVVLATRSNLSLNTPLSAAFMQAKPLLFPLTAWRVDNVILIVLGFALIPISIGRWTLGKTEGMLVLLVYAIYLALIAHVAVS